MIIECNGVPGCGKTILMEGVADYCQTKNRPFKKAGVKEFRNAGNVVEKAGLMFRRALPLILKPKMLFIALFPVWKRTVSFLNIKERVIALMYLCFLLKEYTGDDCLILSDEGIVQTLATISEFADITDNSFEESFEIMRRDDWIGIDCILSMEEAVSRIRKRKRTDSAMDYLGEDELRDYLKVYSSDLEKIRRKQKKCITVDMSRSEELILSDLMIKVKSIL